MIITPQIFEPYEKEIHVGFYGKPINLLEDEHDEFDEWQQVSLPSPAFCFQTHSDCVAIVNIPGKRVDTDGLITTSRELPLLIKMADCVGAILYDPSTKTIAAVHAGWRGLAKKIFTIAIQKMYDDFDVDSSNILIALSPSIEAPEFSDPCNETPDFFHEFIDEENRVHLLEIAKKELLNAGIQEKNLEMPLFCTHTDPKERFWSHRRREYDRRNGAIIMLK